MAAHPKSKRSPEPSEDADPTTEEVLHLLGDKYTRQVFEAVTEQPRTGRDVADAADVSRPTAYRRLNDLRDAGLVTAEMTISEDGHHCERFEATAQEFSVFFDDDGIEAVVDSKHRN
jgi:DNA-binding transcriptional ArsR family regulator